MACPERVRLVAAGDGVQLRVSDRWQTCGPDRRARTL